MLQEKKDRLAQLQAEPSLTRKEKQELEELLLMEFAESEALENGGASLEVTGEASADSVFVFCNNNIGIIFKLDTGETVEIAGMPVSNLKRPDGGAFPGGKYGITRVDAQKWESLQRTYGGMKLFKNELIFAAPTLERGKAMARERSGLRHGMEQINPDKDRRVKSSPKSDD